MYFCPFLLWRETQNLYGVEPQSYCIYHFGSSFQLKYIVFTSKPTRVFDIQLTSQPQVTKNIKSFPKNVILKTSSYIESCWDGLKASYIETISKTKNGDKASGLGEELEM